MGTVEHPGVGANRAARRAAARRKVGAALTATGAAAGAVAGMVATASPAGALTIVVSNTDDSGAGSLRQALADADDGDVIDLTGISGQITLESQLDIEDAVTITGPGASVLTVSGDDTVRVFSMDEALDGVETVTITGITIADGNAGYGGGIFFDCNALSTGAEASLVLDRVVVTSNEANGLGGGLYFDRCDSGDLTITNSAIVGNTSRYNGGGAIWFDDSDALTIVNTTVANNTAVVGGGVSFDDGNTLSVRNTTISGNTATDGPGGGVAISEATSGATFENSTVANNTAGNGGGIMILYGDLSLVQTTISGNTATYGATDGLYLGDSDVNDVALAQRVDAQTGQASGDVGAQQVGTVTITGTIIAGNAGIDVGTYSSTSPITSNHSLFGTLSNVTVNDAGGTQFGVTNPGLDPLTDNGGPTWTMALQAGSPALNTGPDPVPAFTGNEFDQRGPGFPRVIFGRVDIGAYERAGGLAFTG